jgi:HEAT repeat protein
MRRLVLLGLLLPAGCGQAPPLLAHGKPVSHWLEVLRHPDANDRRRAVVVLGNVGAADPAVLPALAGAVKDRDAGVRGAAVLALLKMGPAAREAAPALREAERDRDPRVRQYAARALQRIESAP